jgi:hypothetical protein
VTFTGGSSGVATWHPPLVNQPNMMAASAWTATNDVDQNVISRGPAAYWVQNGAKTWSITGPTAPVDRFEVRSGDKWATDGAASKERSELQNTISWPAGQALRVTYGFMVEAGSTNTAAWMAIGQFHHVVNDGNSPPFSVELVNGDKMAINIYQPGADNYIYTDSVAITRGQTYQIQIDATFHPTAGTLKVTRDGVTLVNYSGPLGWAGMGNVYWKYGIYRASAPETIAMNYSDMLVVPTAALSTSSPLNLGQSAAPPWLNSYLRTVKYT